MRVKGVFFISLFAVCVGILWLVAAVANYRFGILQGTQEPINLIFGITTTSSQLNGVASIAVDAFKAILAIVITVSYQHRSYVLLLVSTVIFLGCVGWSTQSAFGYVLSERASSLDLRAKSADQWSALKKDLDDAEKQRGMVPVHRPTSVVAEEMESRRLSRTWSTTGGCRTTDPRDRHDVAFCQAYQSLAAEQAAGVSGTALDTKIAALRQELSERPRVSAADPIAAAIGIDISSLRGILFAVLVEMISGFGLWILWTTSALVGQEAGPKVVRRSGSGGTKVRRTKKATAGTKRDHSVTSAGTNVVRIRNHPENILDLVRAGLSERAIASRTGASRRHIRAIKKADQVSATAE